MSVQKYFLTLRFDEVGEFNEKQYNVIDDLEILKKYKNLIHKLDIYKVDPLKTIKKVVRSVKSAMLTSDATKIALPYEVASGPGMPAINVFAFLNEDLSTAYVADDGVFGEGFLTDTYVSIRRGIVMKLLKKKKSVLYTTTMRSLVDTFELDINNNNNNINEYVVGSKLIKRLKEIGFTKEQIKSLDTSLSSNENILCRIFLDIDPLYANTLYANSPDA